MIAWLEAGADAHDDGLRAAFARARARARLVVRDVECADVGLRFVACGGRGRPWSPEHLAHLLQIWQGRGPVGDRLELVTEPRAEGGLALVVRCAGGAGAQEGEPAWSLVVAVRGADGEVREHVSKGGRPSEEVAALLAAAGAEELLAGPRGDGGPIVWIKARRAR